MPINDVESNIKEKLVKCLAILDDVEKFGLRDKDCIDLEKNLLLAVQYLNIGGN